MLQGDTEAPRTDRCGGLFGMPRLRAAGGSDWPEGAGSAAPSGCGSAPALKTVKKLTESPT